MKDQNRDLRESDRFLRQALVGLLGLKLRSGATIDELRQLIDECLELADGDSGFGVEQQGLDIHRLGSVLRTWHKEARYLSNDGLPLPLPLSGRAGLRGLIKTYYSKSKVDVVFETLKRAGLIKKYARSYWLPTEGHARISANSQETLDHVSEGVSRFLQTVLNNVNSRSKASLLFEQSCKVRRLPTSKAPAFKVFVRQQAIAFLTAVDDWLEARVEGANRKHGRSKTCAAGVFTFAYLDSVEKNGRSSQGKR